MPIDLKIYITLLVISFILFFIGVIACFINDRIGFPLMLPFAILIVVGLLYVVFYAIWRN